MTNKLFAAVLLLAILTSAAPAQAAYVYEDINVNFANGFNATGQLAFTNPISAQPTFFVACCGVQPTLTGSGKDWLPFGVSGATAIYISLLPFEPPPCPTWAPFCGGHPTGPGPHLELDLAFAFPGVIPQSFSEFTLSDLATGASFQAVSGDVSIVSPVPIPAVLPLFGSGVAALAGFAWRRKFRGEVS